MRVLLECSSWAARIAGRDKVHFRHLDGVGPKFRSAFPRLGPRIAQRSLRRVSVPPTRTKSQNRTIISARCAEIRASSRHETCFGFVGKPC
jgi:hypothetical protein